MSRIVDLIQKKRDGQILSKEEINEMINAAVAGEMEQCQLGAMLMAIYLNGMTPTETASLTESMLHSGRSLNWPPEWKGQIVDKHSTGGVGDKISLILTPALAACGLKVPMITGRGLGFSGGTLDKLESIPGLKVSCDLDTIMECVNKIGCCIVGQTEDIVPADRIMYACRGITSTVDCVPLICGSIISKKAAENISSLVLDIKVGSGTFMTNIEKATELANSLVSVAKEFDISTVAVLTAMEWPIGTHIGNALEVAETIQALNGHLNEDVKELVLTLGGHLLKMSTIVDTLNIGKDLLLSKIKDGSALKKFQELIVCQGVDKVLAEKLTRKGQDVWTVLPRAQFTTEIVNENESGYVQDINARTLANVCLDLGTGRINQYESISYSAGLQLMVQVGQHITKGSVWLIVHHDTPMKAKTLNMAKGALKVGQQKVPQEQLKRVLKVVH